MNQSIADVIEIIILVRDQFNKNPDKFRLHQYRIKALNQIAFRRSRDRNTIANAYIRGLQPYISGTKEFQKYLDEWILNESNEFIDIIKRFIPEKEREDTIADFENKKTEVQQLLDYEAMDSFSQNKYPEGRRKIEIHLTKERKHQLVADAKQTWKTFSDGDVICSVCGFSFFKKYGVYGKDFIEAHHNIPISELSEETIMKVSDLSPVCSNCHKIIHRRRPFLSTEELRKIVQSHNS